MISILINDIKIHVTQEFIAMIVQKFDPDSGIYMFEFEHLETELHSHPAVEIITATKGCFTLFTEKETHADLEFAVIAANCKHKLSASNCAVKLLMVEHRNKYIFNKLKQIEIDLSSGYYYEQEKEQENDFSDKLIQFITAEETSEEYDVRIYQILKYLNENDLSYNVMLKTLCEISGLSESRLSHLFKANMGISIKKYLIWTKLKSTIRQHLENKSDLLSALIHSGFYDQPHFSNSFKSMLGVKPSFAYNSRNIQV